MSKEVKEADIGEIEKAIGVLFVPCQVVEVRALNKFGSTTSGYFDDSKKLALAIKELSDSGEFEGVYYTLNQCNEALLSRPQKKQASLCRKGRDSGRRNYSPALVIVRLLPKRLKAYQLPKQKNDTRGSLCRGYEGTAEMGFAGAGDCPVWQRLPPAVPCG